MKKRWIIDGIIIVLVIILLIYVVCRKTSITCTKTDNDGREIKYTYVIKNDIRGHLKSWESITEINYKDYYIEDLGVKELQDKIKIELNNVVNTLKQVDDVNKIKDVTYEVEVKDSVGTIITKGTDEYNYGSGSFKTRVGLTKYLEDTGFSCK